jgi:hypothetical protein
VGIEVPELVGIADGPHGLHETIGNVERHNDNGSSLGIHQHCPGLPVYFDLSDVAHTQAVRQSPEVEGETHHFLSAINRAGDRRCLAAPVAVGDDVGGEQTDQAVSVSVCDRREETTRELFALSP